MKFSSAVLLLSLAGVGAFSPNAGVSQQQPSHLFSAVADEKASSSSSDKKTQDPLLIRAAKGEKTERAPVWMMRQAGRHMKIYRDLCKTHTTFRQRSEIPEVAVEISLQPYEAYKTDGCILFSDILTPFPGMGMDFTIDEKLGPIMPTIRSWEDLKQLHAIDPDGACPFVGEALRTLRKEVDPETAVLGFVGCPYTLATYLVEGKTSRDYMEIKKMAWTEPDLLHAMLKQLADNLGDYACYQIENGAQLIQIFDSWAGHLSPRDYDTFAAPYQKMVLDKIKATHPEIPTVIYIKHSGALIERMASTGVDVVSLDWTVDMAEGRQRVANGRKAAGLDGPGGVQGNLDPGILYGSHETIKERAEEILKKAGDTGHVMNLGHGIEATTPEENAKFFVDTVKSYRHEA
ncbi:Uroporphyrinogen decarboxylase [Seminavis robusta]|uniref:Uroporphyrinogen decarboxylase n=1 Tax=Seminavis robusta TaxID=568900 RepID=A0A9N8HTE2_9STRA|nr:Uroporphyrinogen decarboxylase [Seminavis robusta]|eukprot:Sro1503_g278020.1 Uroporphyrinogen decarboxylase (404) ;mRNA; f:9376-10685